MSPSRLASRSFSRGWRVHVIEVPVALIHDEDAVAQLLAAKGIYPNDGDPRDQDQDLRLGGRASDLMASRGKICRPASASLIGPWLDNWGMPQRGAASNSLNPRCRLERSPAQSGRGQRLHQVRRDPQLFFVGDVVDEHLVAEGARRGSGRDVVPARMRRERVGHGQTFGPGHMVVPRPVDGKRSFSN
jgi:hypothetical protein